MREHELTCSNFCAAGLAVLRTSDGIRIFVPVNHPRTGRARLLTLTRRCCTGSGLEIWDGRISIRPDSDSQIHEPWWLMRGVVGGVSSHENAKTRERSGFHPSRTNRLRTGLPIQTAGAAADTCSSWPGDGFRSSLSGRSSSRDPGLLFGMVATRQR